MFWPNGKHRVSFRPRESVSFDQRHVTRSPPIGKSIWVGRYDKSVCCSTAKSYQFSCTGLKQTWRCTKKLDHKLQGFINTCLSQILPIRWTKSAALIKNSGNRAGAQLTNTIQGRTGDGLGIPHTPWADNHHLPSLGLEPKGETEERKTTSDMEKELYKLNWRTPSEWPGKRQIGQPKIKSDGS